jgi:hypothetical protein
MRGKYKRTDFVEAIQWAEANMELLQAKWSELNEPD